MRRSPSRIGHCGRRSRRPRRPKFASASPGCSRSPRRSGSARAKWRSLCRRSRTSGRPDEARAMQALADAAIGPSGDVRASFTLHLAESAVEYAEDDFGAAKELVELAYQEGIDAGDDQRLRLAHMWRGEILSVLDDYEEAFDVAGR